MDRQPPPRPDKIRRVDSGISWGWIDHRLRWFLEDMKQEEKLLYFFLAMAANEQGCSWWPTRKITKMLNIGPASLQRARELLERRGLIATRKDELSGRIVYQVLPLPIEVNERIEIPIKLLKKDAGDRPGKAEKGRGGAAGTAAAAPEAAVQSEKQQQLNQEGLSRLRSLLGVEGK